MHLWRTSSVTTLGGSSSTRGAAGPKKSMRSSCETLLGSGNRGPIALIVSSVAFATPSLPDSAAARANWFFRISCAAMRAAYSALDLLDGGRVASLALAASKPSCPLSQRSKRAATSVFTAVAEAPGF